MTHALSGHELFEPHTPYQPYTPPPLPPAHTLLDRVVHVALQLAAHRTARPARDDTEIDYHETQLGEACRQYIQAVDDVA